MMLLLIKFLEFVGVIIGKKKIIIIFFWKNFREGTFGKVVFKEVEVLVTNSSKNQGRGKNSSKNSRDFTI